MTVYVDNARKPFRRMLMCHMIADTTEELLEMVDRIGVDQKHIQFAGLAKEHFDICAEIARLPPERFRFRQGKLSK